MTEISDTELDSSNNNQIGNNSDHEDFNDSNAFDSDQEEEEEDYGAFQDFDGFSDNQDNQDNNQNFAPPASGKINGKGQRMNASDTELVDDGTPPEVFENFEKFPEEIQMNIWQYSALEARRTIVVHLQENTFKFGSHPSTPAFMQVCHRARKYGMEHFSPVDAMGVPHDFTDPQQVNKPYFFVSPTGDDFILKFGDQGFCPSPVYCPKQFGSEHMRRELAAEEEKLQKIDYEERLELDIARDIERAVRGVPAPPPINPILIWQAQNIVINPHHIPAAPGGVAGSTPRNPGEPVFPPASVLPHFFADIRSVGINLDIGHARGIEFDEMSAIELQTWAQNTVKYKFDKVFKEILDYFPHLEHIFAVVRAYGTSNRNRCASNRGFIGGFEKKQWASVDMVEGGRGCMGHNEFSQFEKQAKVWLMHERVDRGMGLNNLEFGLYVQTNIL